MKYGEVFTKVDGDDLSKAALWNLLSFDEENLFAHSRFYSGLLNYVTQKLVSLGISYLVEDPPEKGTVEELRPDLLDGIVLREDQLKAVNQALYYKRGIMDSPTGSGKTEIAAALVRILGDRGLNTLSLVPGINSLNQMHSRFIKRGVVSVGRFGGGYKELNRKHTVAVANSVYIGVKSGKKEVIELLSRTGCLIFMEVQHLKAPMWRTIGENCEAQYRIGMSATPFSTGNNPVTLGDFSLIGITGDLIYRLPDNVLINQGVMATPQVHVVKIPEPRFEHRYTNNWRRIVKYCLNENEYRNNEIAKAACGLKDSGHKVLVLVNEIDHGDVLATLISKLSRSETYFYSGGSRLQVYDGGCKVFERRISIVELEKELSAKDGYVLIGSPAIDEDADFPSTHVLIVASAGRSYRRVIQRAGRVMRPKKGTNVAYIVDFRDTSNFVLMHQFSKREKFYQDRYRGAKNFKFYHHDSAASLVESILNA